MEPADAARIRQSLLDLRAQLLAEGDVKVAADEPIPIADEDEAPHREMDQSIASSRNKERAERLLRIQGALGRLSEDPDSFGVCEACEEPIPTGRLVAMPFARLCVDCQSGREENPHGRRRKRVTDYG